MNIYLVQNDINNDFDTFSSVVVIAENEAKAREIHPSFFITHVKNGKWMATKQNGVEFESRTADEEWVPYSDRDKLTVTLLGTAVEGMDSQVLCSSFRSI